MNDEKFRVSISLDVDLSQQDIDDIMVAALEGGINYWCREAEVVGEYLGEYASDQISRSGSLILHDAESSDKWELTRDKFLNGVKLYFEHGCEVPVEDNAIDTCGIDACAADSIVQYALFGKLVFG
jgi:hypothetical protein